MILLKIRFKMSLILQASDHLPSSRRAQRPWLQKPSYICSWTRIYQTVRGSLCERLNWTQAIQQAGSEPECFKGPEKLLSHSEWVMVEDHPVKVVTILIFFTLFYSGRFLCLYSMSLYILSSNENSAITEIKSNDSWWIVWLCC